MNLYYATLYFPLLGLIFTPFLKGALDRFVLCILVFYEALMLGFKTGGHDYLSYLDYFETIQNAASLDEVMEAVKDPFFYLIIKSLFIFSPSNELIFFTVAMISLSAIAISLPSTIKHKSLTFCLFILFFGGGLYYEAIRAGLGLAFLLLFLRFKDSRGSFLFLFFSVASHLSLAVPAIASYGWFSKIIARYPFIFTIIFALSLNVIPLLLLLNPRALYYTNIEGGKPSFVAIVLVMQFLFYLWTTRQLNLENDSRIPFISSGLITFLLSAILSTYSETTSSRLYELGGAIFFFLVINDFVDKSSNKIPLYNRIAQWGTILMVILVHVYVWYIRFYVQYDA